MKRAGGEKRGNSKDRAARKAWMLATFGDGSTCPCVHCGATVDYDTVTADRVEAGGTYARHNVQPSCLPCNQSRSNKPMSVFASLATVAA